MGKKPKTDGLGKKKKSLQGKNHRFLQMKWHYVRSLLEILLKSKMKPDWQNTGNYRSWLMGTGRYVMLFSLYLGYVSKFP